MAETKIKVDSQVLGRTPSLLEHQTTYQRTSPTQRVPMDRRAFLALVTITTACLAGCSNNQSQDVPTDRPETSPAATEEISEEAAEREISADVVEEKPFSSADQIKGLSSVQRNSVNMLNYLVVLMQEIGESKNSRLALENIYSGLINNVSPDAVDTNTLGWINDILDGLEKYRMLTVKRERLQIIYEKAQVEAAKSAIPSPLSLLSAVSSQNLVQFATSVIYMAVDAAASYSSAMTAAESEYLQGGWELDDQESEQIHQDRKEIFTNTVETVSEYSLPGSLALTEASVGDFVSWQEAKVANRIRFFEKNADVYCALGEYWLLLARSYQEHGDVKKCIKAVETYEELSTGILRKDYSYAKTLSLALAAAADAQDGSFVEHAEKWADAILANCSGDDWALRYYAAQTYIALAAGTGDARFLSRAYETALDNANELIPEQRSLNSAYLSPIQKLDGASGMPWASDEEKEKESYNKMLEEERKVALAPLYEPLVMNLELLRAIAVERPDAIQGSSPEEIIHSDGRLFLVDGLDERYASPNETYTPDSPGISYDCTEIKVPAALVTSSAKVTSVVNGADGAKTVDDWTLERVERGSDDDSSTFVAVYKSEQGKDAGYSDGCAVQLTVEPWPEKDMPIIEAAFNGASSKKMPWDNLAVWDDGYSFERA